VDDHREGVILGRGRRISPYLRGQQAALLQRPTEWV